MTDETSMNRRKLLKTAVSSALGTGAVSAQRAAVGGESPGRKDLPWKGLKIGVASYTLRTLPLDAAIAAIRRVGLSYVSIKDAHLPLNSTQEERKAVAEKFKAAGIIPLSCGNITMENEEADLRRAFDYARDVGLPTIVCSPDPASLPLLDRLVKEYDIRIAIHNHGPEDKRFPSPYDAWDAVKRYDPRLGLCIDVGHTARAKVDPAKAILKCRERLHDLHFKDITEKGSPIEVGRGILDKRAILKALLRIRYPYIVSFEYEKDANDPLPGLAESVGYTRGLLEDLA